MPFIKLDNPLVGATVQAMMDRVAATDYKEPATIKQLLEDIPANELEIFIDQFMVPVIGIARGVLEVKKAESQMTGETKTTNAKDGSESGDDTSGDDETDDEEDEGTDTEDQDVEIPMVQTSATVNKAEDGMNFERVAKATGSTPSAVTTDAVAETAVTPVETPDKTVASTDAAVEASAREDASHALYPTVPETPKLFNGTGALKMLPAKKTPQWNKLWNEELKINEHALIRVDMAQENILFYTLRNPHASFTVWVTFNERNIRPVVRIDILDIHDANAFFGALTELNAYVSRPAMPALLCVKAPSPSPFFADEHVLNVEADIVAAPLSVMVQAAIGLAEVRVPKMEEKKKWIWEGKSNMETDATEATRQAAAIITAKKVTFTRST